MWCFAIKVESTSRFKVADLFPNGKSMRGIGFLRSSYCELWVRVQSTRVGHDLIWWAVNCSLLRGVVDDHLPTRPCLCRAGELGSLQSTRLRSTVKLCTDIHFDETVVSNFRAYFANIFPFHLCLIDLKTDAMGSLITLSLNMTDLTLVCM